MEIIDTINGEDVIVAPFREQLVMLRVHCPNFGAISEVQLSHQQAASLVGALTGIVLEHSAAALEPDENL
jgi:hypothetical protein